MFMTSDKEKLRILPPSDDALAMNVRRGCYQAGWVWGTPCCKEHHLFLMDGAGLFLTIGCLSLGQQQGH